MALQRAHAQAHAMWSSARVVTVNKANELADKLPFLQDWKQ